MTLLVLDVRTVYHRGIEKFHLLDTEYAVLIALNSYCCTTTRYHLMHLIVVLLLLPSQEVVQLLPMSMTI